MEAQIDEIREIRPDSKIQDFLPENLQNSKLLQYINEHLSFKLSDFNSIYNNKEEESRDLLKKCNFLQISEDSATYIEEEINCIFICEETFLTNELLKEIRNIKNITFNRFYKKKDYKWVIVPEKQDRESFLNYIKDKKIKMFNLKKSSIVNSIIYSKDTYDLKDKRKNSDYNYNGNAYKWRKYSKNGYYKHKGSLNSNYYNYNYYKGQKGRDRFNSDLNNNTKTQYNNNYNNNNQNSKIVIEIGEIKYPLTINHKYTTSYLNEVYLKLKNDKFFETKPNYLVEENEIINNKPKNIEIISGQFSPMKNTKAQAFENGKIESENKFNPKIAIPKNNPLNQVQKIYNKFDAIHQNSIIFK